MDFLSSGVFGQGQAESESIHFLALIPRLVMAVLIGVVLATRPWRLVTRRAWPKAEMVQAQILLCTAAAVITAVIGNSVAKAFALVGLGGFVRFRSGLKDPRDAAVLFLLIGLGMACGLGSLGLAAAGAVFVAALLIALDMLGKGDDAGSRMKLSAQADDVTHAEAALRQALGEKNVLVRSTALDLAGKRLELELEEKEPGGIAAAVGHAQLSALREVRWGPLLPRTIKEEYL